MWQGWAEHLLAAAVNLSLAALTVGVRVLGFAIARVMQVESIIVGAIEAAKRRAIAAAQSRADEEAGFTATARKASKASESNSIETTGLLVGF